MLSDILKLFKELKVSEDLIEDRAGKGVCFIFDGLDEFVPTDGDDSIVFKILKKTYLSQSIVIVASRPVAVAKLRYKAHKVVEVLGFLNQQIHDYFDHYPFASGNMAAKNLKVYLKSHPNILHMCYLPIHAAMVAFLFQKLGKIPNTETEIYGHFTCLTLKRNLSKSGEYAKIDEDLDSLNDEEQLCFKQICRLAFDKTVSRKQVMQQHEVNSYFQIRGNSNVEASLGLITIDRIADLYEFRNIYTFTHLTFQEYLAARHISNLSDEKQIELIREYGDKNHMSIVWKFYFGLVKIKPFENKFKAILQKTEGKTLYQIQCTFESQQKITCAQLLKALHYHIELDSEYLSTPNFAAIGYISKSSLIPFTLSLINCNLVIDSVISGIDDSAMHSIECLHIETKSVDGSMMKSIKNMLTKLRSLKRFAIDAKVMKTLDYPEEEKEACNLRCLTELFLTNVDIRPCHFSNMALDNLSKLRYKGDEKGFKDIAHVLKQTKVLKSLDVSGNNIGKEGANLLAKSLKNCSSLEQIDISNNNIASFEMTSILKSLKLCHLKVNATEITNEKDGELLKYLEELSNMQSLEISITKKYFDNFCASCKKWKNLKELNLIFSHSPIIELAYPRCFESLSNLTSLTLKYGISDIQGATSLMRGLSLCSSLCKLDLSNNRICFDEIEVIATSLVQFAHLTELHLNTNWVGDKGARTLSTCLQYYHNLEVLSLSNNKISCTGGKALANNLHHSSKLKKLDLSDNDIDDATYHAIKLSLNSKAILIVSRNPCDTNIQ